jgi:SAM-dependent methyltransferase
MAFEGRRIRRWRHLLANRGPWVTLKAAADLVQRRIAPDKRAGAPIPVELWRNYGLLPAQAHPFDIRHDTDTSGLAWGEDLPASHGHSVWNTAYYGIAPSIFGQAIESVSRDTPDLPEYTFIDLGAGKGRAVILAGLIPFRRVLGVELVPRLHTVAVNNVARVGLSNAEVLLGDASDFPWTGQLTTPLSGQLVLFLYNPFARPVLKSLLRNVEHTLANDAGITRVVLVYVNPELDEELTRHHWIERVRMETVPIYKEDRLADRFGSTCETFAIYRCK